MEASGLGFPYWVAVRRRFAPQDPFFIAGNIERELLAKQVALELTENERYQIQRMEDAGRDIQDISLGGAVLEHLYRELSEATRPKRANIVGCFYLLHIWSWEHLHVKRPQLDVQFPIQLDGLSIGISFVHCPIVSCGVRLSCLEDFEDHYHARHMSACAICSRVYPTSRLLSIHVSEAHDSFFAAKVAHGFPMYECLVEGCGAKLKSYKSRQQHLIDKHKFPTSFEFKKAKPSKHQRQNNQHKQHAKMKDKEPFTVQQKKYQPKKNPQNEQEALCNRMEVEEIDELVSAVSKLSTSDSTPSNISFGRRHTRAFTFIPRSLRKNLKHQSDAME